MNFVDQHTRYGWETGRETLFEKRRSCEAGFPTERATTRKAGKILIYKKKESTTQVGFVLFVERRTLGSYWEARP